jgi:UDP-N-acetylglucosamine 3-dehydrogenase
MGRNHVRLLSAMDGVELAALVDVERAAAHRAGVRHLPCYATADELFAREELDAVVIATPTDSHAEIAQGAIERGLNVLVEKPIALTVEEGGRLVNEARRAGVVLAVGHVERFNPAVLELGRRLAQHELGQLFHFTVRREGPLPLRITDVGVVRDLATHDLDILGYLLRSSPETIFAQTAKRTGAIHEELVTATLCYPGGVLATLQVNWLTPFKVRQLTVTGERGLYSVDYLSQKLTWYENTETSEGKDWDALATLQGSSKGQVVHYPIQQHEPLASELQGFVRAITGQGDEIVTGEEGVRALALASALLLSARRGEVLHQPLDHPT